MATVGLVRKANLLAQQGILMLTTHTDAFVATLLCEGGAIAYELVDTVNVTDQWLFENCVPNIRRQHPNDTRFCTSFDPQAREGLHIASGTQIRNQYVHQSWTKAKISENINKNQHYCIIKYHSIPLCFQYPFSSSFCVVSCYLVQRPRVKFLPVVPSQLPLLLLLSRLVSTQRLEIS